MHVFARVITSESSTNHMRVYRRLACIMNHLLSKEKRKQEDRSSSSPPQAQAPGPYYGYPPPPPHHGAMHAPLMYEETYTNPEYGYRPGFSRTPLMLGERGGERDPTPRQHKRIRRMEIRDADGDEGQDRLQLADRADRG